MYFKNRTILIIMLCIFSFNVFALSEKEKTEAEKAFNKGRALGMAGKLDSALFYAQKAVELSKKQIPTDSSLIADSYQSLGIIYKYLGNYNQTIHFYNKAEKIYLNLNIENLLGFLYINKAIIFKDLQDYAKAENFYTRALSIFYKDSVYYKKQIAIIYNNIGTIYLQKEKYNKAINFYQKSLQVDKSNYITHLILGNIADCYKGFKNYKEAEKYYKLSIQVAEKNYGKNNIWLAYQQLIYANFLSKLNKDIPTAKKYFSSALNIYKNNLGEKHPDIADCYNYMGEFYLKQNMTDSALHYFQLSLMALSNKFNDSNLSQNPYIYNVFYKPQLLGVLKNKAHALYLKSKLENNTIFYYYSLNAYDLAIETIAKIRAGYLSEESKLLLAENSSDIFSGAVKTAFEIYQLAHEEKYAKKAFEYSEAGKAAILNEALQNNKALNIGGIPDSLINLEKQLEKSIWSYEELIYEENKKKTPDKNKLEYWNRYLFEKEIEHTLLSKYLEDNFKEYHKLKYEESKVDVEKLQKKLTGKVLIEYFMSEDNLYTFLVNKKSIFFYKQEINDDFDFQLNNILRELSNNNFSNHTYQNFTNFQESSYYLYNLLIKPIEQDIKKKKLVIIPAGKLSYLPFEALTTKETYFEKINYKNLPYFVYKNNVSYSYSANLLYDNEHYSKEAAKKLGAFAPIYSNAKNTADHYVSFRQEYREKLFPLKGIKEEVEHINNLIGGDKYLDYDANEKVFKKVAPEYDILHLAMHTLLDDKNPMYSKMAFTQVDDSIEDGFLNTYELYNMKLNSRMAVLSSCNSGSGKLQRGEGVMSLARGFIYSGCPSIIMTLWSVEDKSGVELMKTFYKYLSKGRTKSKSLEFSKTHFIKNADQLHSHPYFWSGYVVIGDNSRLFIPYDLYFLIAGIALLIIIFTRLLIRVIKRYIKKRRIKNFVFRDIKFN